MQFHMNHLFFKRKFVIFRVPLDRIIFSEVARRYAVGSEKTSKLKQMFRQLDDVSLLCYLMYHTMERKGSLGCGWVELQGTLAAVLDSTSGHCER